MMITDGSLIDLKVTPNAQEVNVIAKGRLTQILEPVPLSQFTSGIASATLFT